MLCLVPQSCPTLCDPIDCSSPGSSVHGIFQARILCSLVIYILQEYYVHWSIIYISRKWQPTPILENSMDKGVWPVTLYKVAESDMTEQLTLQDFKLDSAGSLVLRFLEHRSLGGAGRDDKGEHRPGLGFSISGRQS